MRVISLMDAFCHTLVNKNVAKTSTIQCNGLRNFSYKTSVVLQRANASPETCPEVTEYPHENKAFAPGMLLKSVLNITLKNNLARGSFESEKVIEFYHPAKLKELFDLSISRSGSKEQFDIDEILNAVVRYSVKTQHPNFFNQFYGGIDEVGLAGAWLTEALNTNTHTYEVAPIFVLIEQFLIETFVRMFGWQDGDGIFSPGGSVSNMYGIACARHSRFPDIKKSGMFGKKPLVMFTSDMSHYSVRKAASWMGFGSDQVVEVKSDSEGRMKIDSLKKAITSARKIGKDPFLVNATSGTTVLGAFDPLHNIGDVCQQENLWFHVDACWGGSVALSSKHRHLLDGIQRANSISWNPHKMLSVPMQCSAFLVKQKNLLSHCNSIGASYLFQKDKFYDMTYDTGDKSVQCGRKIDAFKVWLMFKVHGTELLEERIDTAFEVASYLESEIKRRPGFRMVNKKPQCTNVCFWYIPHFMRGLSEDESWRENLHKVAPAIKSKMMMDGSLMVTYQPLEEKGLVNFFRIALRSYPPPTKEKMDYILNEIERYGVSLDFF